MRDAQDGVPVETAGPDRAVVDLQPIGAGEAVGAGSGAVDQTVEVPPVLGTFAWLVQGFRGSLPRAAARIHPAPAVVLDST